MKTIILSLLISIFMITSCSDREKKDVILDKSEEIPLDLRSEFLSVWCRTSYNIKILTEGDYIVQSDDEDILTADIFNNLITIRTKKPGKTTITVLDKHIPNRKSILDCYSTVFENIWGQPTELMEVYKDDVVIGAKERKHVDKITEELLQYGTHLHNCNINFMDNGQLKIKTYFPERTAYSGSYNYDYLTGVLKLNYNNKEEIFWTDILPPAIESNHPSFVIALHQDFTEKYSLIYSQDSITEVTLITHLVSYGSRWWRNGDQEEYNPEEIVL